MELLIDLFGYLSIVVHGLTIFAQSLTLGGVFFLVFLCRPLAARIPDGIEISRRCAAIAGWAAIALIVAEILTIGLEAAALSSAVGIGIADTLGAQFAVAGAIDQELRPSVVAIAGEQGVVEVEQGEFRGEFHGVFAWLSGLELAQHFARQGEIDRTLA